MKILTRERGGKAEEDMIKRSLAKEEKQLIFIITVCLIKCISWAGVFIKVSV